MPGKRNIRVPPGPPTAPPPPPRDANAQPPLAMLIIALREFVEVATEALQVVVDEYNEERNNR